jgi:hypothetical protein
MRNTTVPALKAKYTSLEPVLDERARRLWAATEARAIGWGGISQVSEATGLSRITIEAGLTELDLPVTRTDAEAARHRLRRLGGGRNALVDPDPDILRDLETPVDPMTRGDPMSPLRWTCKRAAKLAAELQARGHAASERSVNRLLHGMDSSLPSNRKTIEGKAHPDRDAQFRYINRRVEAFQRQGQPVVSVDAKKKELVGPFRNGGREWQPKGQPDEVEVYDFLKKDPGKAIPSGIYDQTTDTGWVSVGVDHDTAEFAVESLRRWWRKMGRRASPRAERRLITADGGGSNGSRCRLWEVELQGLADATGLRISACHFPPGTSKWNEIEHRMSCHITEDWRGRPLVSREVVVNLIGPTTTETGLAIRSEWDEGRYPTGRKVSDEQLEELSLKRDKFHGEWNYSISPR